MAEITERISISRPPEDVWAVLAEFGAISRWAPNVEHSSLTTDQREGVGTVRRVQVGRNGLLERITEWEPGHCLGYAIEGLPPVIRSAVNIWELEASSSGSTVVSLTSRIDAGPRPPQQVVAKVSGRALAKASREMLEGLKSYLEDRMVGGPDERGRHER